MVLILIFISFSISQNFPSGDKSTISNKLFNQAKCWNSGNLNCFMEDYWKSDSLMYIGKNGVTYGWHNTLENYKKKYPTKNEMGHLSFEIVTLNQLDNDHYFMVGKWHLKREMGDVRGHFSLIWGKIENEWVIIADHSS